MPLATEVDGLIIQNKAVDLIANFGGKTEKWRLDLILNGTVCSTVSVAP